jgi:hypothetical protein
MRSLLLAFAVLAALAPTARAEGLSASAGDRYGNTTGMVAGRPAVIVSTLYLADGDEGCERPGDLRATLKAPRGVSVRGATTLTPRARGGSRDDRMVNATWHVRAARADVAWGYVKWQGTGVDGKRCTHTQHLRVVATSAPPQLSVIGAVRHFDANTGVLVRAVLPGVRAPAGEAFDAFFNEQHVLGRARRGLRALLRPAAFAGGGFDADGVSCLLVVGSRASVGYRLRFTWNHAIGAASVVRSGSVPVVTVPRTYTERACERQFRPTPESPCTPCESGDADVASMARPMTAAAEQTTSRP